MAESPGRRTRAAALSTHMGSKQGPIRPAEIVRENRGLQGSRVFDMPVNFLIHISAAVQVIF